MLEQFGDPVSRLDPQTRLVLEHYKGAGYGEINEQLRAGNVDRFTAEQWLAITQAIASDQLTEPVDVFRGISYPPLADLVLAGVLDEISHDGFVSVSLLEGVSIGYLSTALEHTDQTRPDFEPANVLLSATLPIGTHAAPIQLVVPEIPGAPDAALEAELLLHAGSSFLIDDIDDSDLSCVRVSGRWVAP